MIKLIINLPEKTIQRIRSDYGHGIKGIRFEDKDIIVDAIYYGISLDSVKAEIEKQIERDFAFSEAETLKVPYHYGSAGGLQVAIRILDTLCAESEVVCTEKI